MDGLDEHIGGELRRIVHADAQDRFPIMSGKVESVNEAEGSCSVVLSVDGEGATEGVSLNAVLGNDNGVYLIPAEGSVVWVAEVDGPGKYGIVKFSNLEKVSIKANVLVEINGGANGGLTITPVLRTELDKVKSMLTHLVSVINGVSIPEPGSGAASALQVALASAIASDTLPDFSDIENEDVKH